MAFHLWTFTFHSLDDCGTLHPTVKMRLVLYVSCHGNALVSIMAGVTTIQEDLGGVFLSASLLSYYNSE